MKILDGTGEVRLVFARRPDLPGEAVELSGTQWRLLDENDDYGDRLFMRAYNYEGLLLRAE